MVDYLDGVNIAVPDGATAAMSTVDNDLRDLKNRLLNSFGLEHTLTGEHKIPYGNTASRPASPVANQIYINTQRGMIEYWDGAAWQDAITLPVGMAAGSKLWFYNNAAPTGYTFVSALNDRVLSVTSTVGDGGAAGGGWTISGLTATEPGHTHGPGSYAIPTHGILANVDAGVQNNLGVRTHAAMTGASASSTVAITVAADGLWRPAFARGIVCTKD